MNVQTMQMDPQAARRHYLEYRSSVRKRREQRRREAAAEANAVHAKRSQIEREEDDLRAAYRAMALGHRVLHLTQVMNAAGLNDKGLPVLAVARSDWEWCHYDAFQRKMNFRPQGRNSLGPKIELEVKFDTGWKTARALVPPVPPRFMPESLEGYFTLWEAEWQPAPPEDPILMKRIGSEVYVVVAQWDLTPIEQAVLEGRFA